MAESPPDGASGSRPGAVGALPGLPWRDLGAGFCVAGLLIPEAVAYAGLAGVPVVHALTAAMAGLAIYAVFGSSRFAIVAPTSSTATLSAAAALAVAGPGGMANSHFYTSVLIGLVLLGGLLLMLLALARQGQLSAFVSRPVLRGFAFALALTIAVRQMPHALGLVVPQTAGSDPLQLFLFAMTHIRQWHVPTILVTLAATAAIVVLRPWPRLPASMLVIVLSMVVAGWLGLTSLGVREVGAIGFTTPELGVPVLVPEDWLRLGELAFGLVVLIFAESWGSIRTMALTHGDPVDANHELLVIGACNVGSALMQGMAVGAGFSATAANAAAGAVSRWAGAVALGVIASALWFAAPMLHLLPQPVLAVAVIAALWHALSPGPLLAVWNMDRDRIQLVAAVLAVLMFGVLHGMLVAIALSILSALRRFSQPVVHELVELGSSRNFVALAEHASAGGIDGLIILRPEEPLFFASAEKVVTEILHRVRDRNNVRAVVLSLEESSDLDSTALECLLELDQHLRSSGKSLALARVKDAVRGLLARWDPDGLGREDRMFWSVADAVQASCIHLGKASDGSPQPVPVFG